MSESYEARLVALRCRLSEQGDLLVAFSGGVDSTVLLHAAHSVLGERAVAFVADSPSLPRRELAEARSLAASIGAALVVHATGELADERYVRNAPDRCYFCKHTLFSAMVGYARQQGFSALAFGEITDDLRDSRPGARAAHELGVVAPLREAGLGKQDVRRYAREHALAVADKPASACLASRIPHGTAVTPQGLARVERSEDALRAFGLRVLRVRDHGQHARLEVGADEHAWALRRRGRIEGILRGEGFQACELAVYRAPSALPEPPAPSV